MTRKFLLSGFGALLLLIGGLAQADPELYNYALNIDGTVSEIIIEYGDIPGDPVPAGVDDTAFDDITGLGSLVITITGAGAHSILAFFDHEIDEILNTYFNEYGSTGGATAAGQSWEIDEPEYLFGDIFTNFENSALDNSNNVPSGFDDDVSLAMGWDFILAAGQTATIDFLLSTVMPPSGFWLRQVDPDSDDSFFLSSTLTITGGAAVPEPGTLWLLGAGLLGLGLSRRRNLADS